MSIKLVSVLSAILINCILCFGQDSAKTMNSFLGVEFGSPISSVKQVMSEKSEANLDSKHSNKKVLFYDGVNVCGHKTLYVAFHFSREQFEGTTAEYSSSLEANIFDLYEEIKSDLNSKYYITKDDYRSFTYPYENGDGQETTAIKLGKAKILSVWKFPQNDGSENSIFLSITEEMCVRLLYNCGKLSDKSKDKVKKVKEKDSTPNVDSFLGIKFGSSVSTVKQALSKRPGAKFDLKGSTKDALVYDGITVAGKNTSYVTFFIYKGQLDGGVAFFSTSLEAKIIDLYEEIKSDLNSKYYITKDDCKSFKYPYKDGDGQETTAIKLGKAEYISRWIFPQEDGTKNTISLGIDEDLTIHLIYNYGKLYDEEKKETKKAESKDY
jgi:hypothetical protein